MPRSHASLVELIEQQGLIDPRIVEAFRLTDRADFVPEQLRGEAYLDRPVTIPFHQTTSQPSLIAHMIAAAAVRPESKVLEIGTGYGFQTALLARLAREVVSVERLEALAEAAYRNLARAGIDIAEVIVGNGCEGATGKGPFDSIVVSAAASEIPSALVEQLADGGHLVIPVKTQRSDDVLQYRKIGNELEEMRLVTPARFVPLVQAGPE